MKPVDKLLQKSKAGSFMDKKGYKLTPIKSNLAKVFSFFG